MPRFLLAQRGAESFPRYGRSSSRREISGKRCVRALRFELLEGRALLSAVPHDAAIEVFGAAPALFIENQGQWQDASVHYRFRGPGLDVSFTNAGLKYLLMQPEGPALDGASSDENLTATAEPYGGLARAPIVHTTQFSVSFAGANAVAPIGLNEAATKFNFLLGDPAQWREGVSSFAVVAYEDLYDGIDLHTFGSRDSLKYEFYVAPGADWRQIQIHYDGIEGLSIDDNGALRIRTELGELIDTAPYIYQYINGQHVEVAGSFVLLDADSYTFEIQGNYDPAVDLIIDPYVQWSTYLGGTGSDYGNAIATNSAGEIFVTGYTNTAGWVSGGYDTSFGGSYDAYVTKLSATGQHLWSTYLGGTGTDEGNAIAVNSAGEVFATGQMYSTAWASGGYDTTNGGESDAFVVKLSTSGSHVWSTYLGGSALDYGSGIALDSAGNVLVTGQSALTGTWVVGGYDTSYNGGTYDAFAAKLSPTGQRTWITYIGGDHDDFGQNVAVDSAGAVVVSGYTRSSGWVSGGFDTVHDGAEGSRDAFVVKISSTGVHQWSTYLGGSSTEHGYGVAVNASNEIIVTGYTQSPDWVSGGLDSTLDGTFDAFAVKLSSIGEHLWSTYLGGSGDDRGEGIALYTNGDIILTGFTNSASWVSGGFDTGYNGGTYDAYIVKLNNAGEHLWSSYLGGSTYDVGNGVATIGSTVIVVTGNTNSSNWVAGGFDSTFGGNYDPFVARISDTNPSPPALPGDYNRNNKVDAADYVQWRKTLGTFNVTPYSGADGNGDGRIGQEDYDVWRAQFGQSIPAAGSGSTANAGAASVLPDATEDSSHVSSHGVARQFQRAARESQDSGPHVFFAKASSQFTDGRMQSSYNNTTKRKSGTALGTAYEAQVDDRDAALVAWLTLRLEPGIESRLDLASPALDNSARNAADAVFASLDLQFGQTDLASCILAQV